MIVEIKELLKEIENICLTLEYQLDEYLPINSNQTNLIPNLLEIEYSLADRRDFLNFCYKTYHPDTRIRQFDHFYSSTDALKEFFRQTFLYRLLRKSLQNFELDFVYLFRFYLQDIEQQLKFAPTVSTTTTTVYSAHFVTEKQIELLENAIEQSEIIRFDFYLIGRKDRDELIKVLDLSPNRKSSPAILFQIEQNQLAKQYENWILFPIETQFRVNSIEYQNQMYLIQISTVNQLKLCLNRKKKPMDFVHRLKQLGRYDDAELILHRLLNQYPRKSSQLSNELGRLYQHKCSYEKSLEFYEKSLVNVPNKDRAYRLNDMGCIYDYLEQYEIALEFYSVALSLIGNDLDRAMCWNNRAISLANQSKFDEALQVLERSLQSQLTYLPESDLDVAISYANIGAIHLLTEQFQLALEFYRKAEKIFRHYSSPLCQAITFQNLAQIFAHEKQFDEAVRYFQRSMDIFKRIRPENHPTLVFLQQKIDLFKQFRI